MNTGLGILASVKATAVAKDVKMWLECLNTTHLTANGIKSLGAPKMTCSPRHLSVRIANVQVFSKISRRVGFCASAQGCPMHLEG